MPEQKPDPRLGTSVAGYKIERRIGRGGMGVVYLAEHMTLRRRAALKIITPDLAEDSDFRERFVREARIAATLTHPNVVTVYDAGEVEGLLYIAMQYVPGPDLSKILHEEGRLGPYRALDVCRQVAAALDAAHGAGLIHRDVKPANVLIDGRHAYLTDFGLTKERAGTKVALTRSGEVVGTTHYLAPEQVEGGDVDGRADVYGLACVLFHLLTGEVPFPRDSDMSVMYAHVHDEPPKLTERRPQLPEGLDAVLGKALEKTPDRRFSSCEDFIAAARAVVDAYGPLSESSSTRRPSQVRHVPAEGDDPSAPTATGGSRPVPTGGDSSSMGTLTGLMVGGRRPIVMMVGLDANSRAVCRVGMGTRCEVLEATTAEEAIQIARNRRPDVVLVDTTRPDSPAAAVSSALRADAVTRDAKIVLLAGRQDARRLVNQLGADDALTTPFSPLQLQVKLRRMIGTGAVGA